MHYDAAIDPDTNEERKPEIITFYNRTKCGVDILDKMCKQYSVLRNSRRWPLTIFFDLMNIVGVNALVINQMNALPEKITRRNFLHDLSFNLIKPLLIRRASNETLPRQLKFRIGALLDSTAQEFQEPQHDLTPKTQTSWSLCTLHESPESVDKKVVQDLLQMVLSRSPSSSMS
ncbi:hypothetical protein HF086_016301 [Spodoptera exigua]|uniref:PiggyBac transposable element-derived protein domain-containing protein n=1 Tax=Spodoptera exigua TaxID=7107 RepID=A0A922MAJ7_SPOEX|nr:hypothetical protein HF086_016301 [Spodoptera exigua]